MTCSVVIPTRQRAPMLETTLDSLASQSERDFEVIVVCDGEDSETRALSEAYSANYPLRWIFTTENRGQASARNTGVSAARGEILLFLDDDTVAALDLLYQHRQQHETQHMDKALVVYGRLVHRYVREPHSHTERLLRMERERSEAEFEAHLTCLVQSIDLDHRYRWCGSNSSVTRTAFLACGGLDPGLDYICEDWELGSRLYDDGVRFIFEPRALAYHRETKDISNHLREVCQLTGRADAYRAFSRGQRNPQTRGLAAAQQRNPLRRLKLRCYWNKPDMVRKVAAISRRITAATGSGLSFQIWRRAELAAGYWQGVKSEGLTLKALRELVGKPLQVLRFQNIVAPRDRTEKNTVLSPRKFLQVLRTLRKLKYSSVSPAEGFSAGACKRGLVLTFDGYGDFYSEVFPHVCVFGLKPVVFLALGRLGDMGVWDERTGSHARMWLSVEQVREMHQQGIQFGSYGLTHAWLPDMPDADLRRELLDSKARLEDLLGSGVTCFAYPGGGVDQRVRAAVARAGYQYGFSRRAGLNFWDDRLALKCITLTEADTTVDLALKLATGRSIAQHLPAPLRRILRAGDPNERVRPPQGSKAPPESVRIGTKRQVPFG